MKKLTIALLITIFCSISTIYAESDIQIGLSGPTFEIPKNASLFNININNHNFFGEKENVGFSEYVSFSPLTSDLFSRFPGFNLSLFAGPSFKFTADTTDFILSTGFKYFFNYTRSYQKFPDNITEESEPALSVTGTKIFTAYAFSLDFQIKFFADKRFSFVLGIPASIGMGSENYTEKVTTSNPNSIYMPLTSVGKMEEYIEIGLPYFMISLNL